MVEVANVSHLARCQTTARPAVLADMDASTHPIDHVALSLRVAMELVLNLPGEAVWALTKHHGAVAVADERVVALANGSARIVAEVSVGTRVVATLLGAIAGPGEWELLPPQRWPA